MLAQLPGHMAAATPTLFLTALLYLGLCRGSRDLVQTESLPKPSIWADPGPRVPNGGSVTIWCRGPPKASEFRLYNERDSEGEFMEESPAHSGQAYISLRNLNVHRTGQYQCSYSSANHSEQRSDNLTLVLTGLFPAPLLEAHPSPVVASGKSVSLCCSTRNPNTNTMGTFHLLKEGDAEPQQLEPQFSQESWQANFSLGPVNDSHGVNYSCYVSAQSQPYSWSLPSAPLRLQVTGVFDPPSLLAQPGPLVQSGDAVTLRCHSQKFSIFALTKGDAPPHSLHGQRSPDFSLGPVSASHGGRYHCFGGHDHNHLWSEPSGPLDILVAGKGTGNSPELQALSETHVPAGRDITLLCRSTDSADTFYLAQDGSATKPLQCLLPHPGAPSQVNFTLRPTQDGTYRCYSSNSSAPHLLSTPSQPLRLQVSGLTLGPGELDFLTLLLGLSGALLGLLLLLLLFFHHHRHQAGHQKSNTAITHIQSEEGTQMNPQMYINHEDQGVTYAQVNRTRIGQQVAPEDAQDVTYAQLNHFAHRRQPTAASSPEELPENHTVYASLAIH